MPLPLNTKIRLSPTHKGTIKYKGFLKDKNEEYFGIDLDEPVGNHNGCYKGVRYFYCEENCGIFVPVGRVMGGSFIARKYYRGLEGEGEVEKENVEEREKEGEENVEDYLKENSYNSKNTSKVDCSDLKNNTKLNSYNSKINSLNSSLNLQKLRILHKTQKLYYKSIISDLTNKLKKCKKNIKKEETKYKLKEEKINEFLSVIEKNCLRMKKRMDEIVGFKEVDCDILIILRELVDCIVLGDEEGVQRVFGWYRDVMGVYGVECVLD